MICSDCPLSSFLGQWLECSAANRMHKRDQMNLRPQMSYVARNGWSCTTQLLMTSRWWYQQEYCTPFCFCFDPWAVSSKLGKGFLPSVFWVSLDPSTTPDPEHPLSPTGVPAYPHTAAPMYKWGTVNSQTTAKIINCVSLCFGTWLWAPPQHHFLLSLRFQLWAGPLAQMTSSLPHR